MALSCNRAGPCCAIGQESRHYPVSQVGQMQSFGTGCRLTKQPNGNSKLKYVWKAAFLLGFGSLPLWATYLYLRGELGPATSSWTGVEWIFIFVALPLTVTATTIALVVLLIHWRTKGAPDRKLRIAAMWFAGLVLLSTVSIATRWHGTRVSERQRVVDTKAWESNIDRLATELIRQDERVRQAIGLPRPDRDMIASRRMVARFDYRKGDTEPPDAGTRYYVYGETGRALVTVTFTGHADNPALEITEIELQ